MTKEVNYYKKENKLRKIRPHLSGMSLEIYHRDNLKRLPHDIEISDWNLSCVL
jgi:hypothetical protein